MPFFRVWLGFQDEQESPERGECFKTTTSSQMLYCHMSVKIFNPREPGYFPTSELKRFLLERRKPKPQESQQPIRRKENNFKSQLEFKVKPKFYI